MIVCAIGALIGLVNGLVVAYRESHSFHRHHGYNDHRLWGELSLL